MQIHESDYGNSPNNFHISKEEDRLHIELTYPPHSDAENTHGQCRYVYVNQESVRASDGIRIYYDFERDGFVIEQPKQRIIVRENYDEIIEDWIEVGFFRSWHLMRGEEE